MAHEKDDMTRNYVSHPGQNARCLQHGNAGWSPGVVLGMILERLHNPRPDKKLPLLENENFLVVEHANSLTP